MPKNNHNWAQGAAYEKYMGRWSLQVASEFVAWIGLSPGLRWLDFGCGTGALTEAILNFADPDQVVGCDTAAPFIEFSRARIFDDRARFVVASIEELPEIEDGFDVIVSGLALNFLAEPVNAVKAMMDRLRPGGLIGAYVWDYSGRMDFLQVFWDVARALDDQAKDLDEGLRFPLSKKDALVDLFLNAGLSAVRGENIDITTRFSDFSDYWAPFTEGTGPAPSYVASLSPTKMAQLEDHLQLRLIPEGDRPIELIARTWAVCGTLS